MAAGVAATVVVRRLAKLSYETALALQLSLARKYKDTQLDEVRTAILIDGSVPGLRVVLQGF